MTFSHGKSSSAVVIVASNELQSHAIPCEVCHEAIDVSGSVSRSGWLHKTGRVIGNWKNRWFAAASGHLLYYRSEHSYRFEKALGVVHLGTLHSLRLTRRPPAGATVEINASAKGPTPEFAYCFRVTCVDRSLNLAAPSDDARREWVRVIVKEKNEVNHRLSCVRVMNFDG